MATPDPDILVQRFIDNDLSDAELEEALHRIAEDPEARDLLRFELRMTQDLAQTTSSAPPPNFASDMVEALPPEPATADAETTSASAPTWLRRVWRGLAAPITVPLRPAPALLAALVVGAIAWGLWPAAPSSPSPAQPAATAGTSSAPSPQTQTVSATSSTPSSSGTVWIRFLYRSDDARSVAVAGDFNQWTPVSLTPRTVDGRTVWTGLVPVPRGEHEYQFVIDGERWVPDPLASEKRRDGFGAKNAVLEV